LRDSLEVTRFHKEKMPMEHGRSLFKLSEGVTQDSPDDVEGAEKLLEEAVVYFQKGKPGEAANTGVAAFEDRINISWR
jgi:hypothetical protein